MLTGCTWVCGRGPLACETVDAGAPIRSKSVLGFCGGGAGRAAGAASASTMISILSARPIPSQKMVVSSAVCKMEGEMELTLVDDLSVVLLARLRSVRRAVERHDRHPLGRSARVVDDE